MNRKTLLFFSIFLLLTPLVSQAGILDNIDCVQSGACQLEDIAAGFVAVINWMLGTIGGVALLYFIWGGIQWLTSMGNPNRVKRGNEIMLGTIFALIITFTSYIILNFFVNDLLIGDTGDQQFKIADECKDASGNRPRGTQCNVSLGGFYRCDGVGNCITACAVKRLETDQNWRCMVILKIDDFRGQATRGGLCPGEEQGNVYCALP